MEPRARVSVWPGRRRVPGIVAPDSWGARGAECLPRDVLRHTLPAAVSFCATVLRRATVCAIVTGPAPRKHAPPQAVFPARLMGVWELHRRHLANSGPDFRSSSLSCGKRTDTDYPSRKIALTPKHLLCQLPDPSGRRELLLKDDPGFRGLRVPEDEDDIVPYGLEPPDHAWVYLEIPGRLLLKHSRTRVQVYGMEDAGQDRWCMRVEGRVHRIEAEREC